VVTQDLRGRGKRVFRKDRTIRGDFHGQRFEVDLFADTSLVDRVANVLDRREDGVHGDDTDWIVSALVLITRNVTASTLHTELNGEAGAFRNSRHVVLRVEYFVLARCGGDVLGGPCTRAFHDEADVAIGSFVGAETDTFQVENDIGDVFSDAFDRGELVLYAIDLEGRDCDALQGRKQHTTKGITDGYPEATLEWLDHKTTVGFCRFFEFDAIRHLDRVGAHIRLISKVI